MARPSGFPLSGINLESAAHSKKTCLTAGFFVVRPSGFPLSGINLESAAHSKKTCLTAGFFVVRPSGFEPLAYRVGVCHSIQLSYGRIFSRSYYSKVRPKSKADFLFPFAAPDVRCIQVQMRSPRRRKRPLAFDSKAALSFRKCRDCNPGIYLIQSRSELEHAPNQYA